MCIKEFIKSQYLADKLVSNKAVLAALSAEYPHVQFSLRTVYYWKSVLRRDGIDIPLQKRKEPR